MCHEEFPLEVSCHLHKLADSHAAHGGVDVSVRVLKRLGGTATLDFGWDCQLDSSTGTTLDHRSVVFARLPFGVLHAGSIDLWIQPLYWLAIAGPLEVQL